MLIHALLTRTSPNSLLARAAMAVNALLVVAALFLFGGLVF
jgi:hypothetical protein